MRGLIAATKTGPNRSSCTSIIYKLAKVLSLLSWKLYREHSSCDQWQAQWIKPPTITPDEKPCERRCSEKNRQDPHNLLSITWFIMLWSVSSLLLLILLHIYLYIYMISKLVQKQKWVKFIRLASTLTNKGTQQIIRYHPYYIISGYFKRTSQNFYKCWYYLSYSKV